MIERDEIAAKAAALQEQLQGKFGVKSRTLAQALKRTGRRLPRRLRQQGQLLVKAEAMAASPKLARQLDRKACGRAYDEITAFLKTIDVAEQRKDRWLRLAAALAFNVIVVSAVFVWWLWWRGYV